MRVLAVADTTEGWLDDFSVLGGIDLILTLGDLYSVDILRLTSVGVPIAGVYGNHCQRGYIEEAGGTDLSGGGIAGWTNSLGMSTIGVSGCVRYKPFGDIQFSQDEYLEALAPMPAADLVVTHCPPRGINDQDDPAHIGINVLRRYVDHFRPAHLFHGHTYPDQPLRSHGSTQVHYVHGWELIEVA